ncbi:guanylate-binding protein 3-like [Cetorhinus maximus]
MWCLPHPNMDGHCLVLLDTEGFGDVEKGDQNNDTKLFAIAILMSSMFVYNSKGTIDQQALQDINYVTELTKLIRTKSGAEKEQGENFMEYFPGFVWVVRDFMLELIINKRKITPDEYLENALKLKSGSDEKTKQFNLPKQCIRYYFRSRNCFVFDPPGKKKVLQNIETADDSELDADFVQSSNEFCDFIYTNAEKKTVPGCGGKVVTGAMFAHLLNTYVDIISNGKLACLDNVVQSLADTENEKARIKAIGHYEEQMKQLLTLPTETAEELNTIHEKCHKEAFDMFLKRALGEREEHKDKLQRTIEGIFKDYSKRNEYESEKKCKDLLTKLFEKIDIKLNNNTYATAGGYSEYLTDRRCVENRYVSEPRKGVKAKEILREFLDQRVAESESIRQKDQSLTDEERRMEAKKDRQAMMELQKAAMEQQMQMMKEIFENALRSNEENNKQFMKMLAQEREAGRTEKEKFEEIRKKESENMESESGRCVIQ